MIFSIGSATSFAAVQLCRPTERAPLNDPATEREGSKEKSAWGDDGESVPSKL